MTERSAENDAPVCPWCKATGVDPCRTTDGQRRVPHKARARMERAARRALTPPHADRPDYQPEWRP